MNLNLPHPDEEPIEPFKRTGDDAADYAELQRRHDIMIDRNERLLKDAKSIGDEQTAWFCKAVGEQLKNQKATIRRPDGMVLEN